MQVIEGTAFCFGDYINTDYIISSRRKKDTINPDELVQYLMEDIRPGFYQEIGISGIIVAGKNFGCGSAMEVAAQVVYSAGIRCILAKSFARSYFRNAINNGIMPIETDTSFIQEGDHLSIQIQDNCVIRILDLTNGYYTESRGITGKAKDILDAGGLVAYVRCMKVEGRNCI